MLPVVSSYLNSTPEFRNSRAEMKGGSGGEFVGTL